MANKDDMTQFDPAARIAAKEAARREDARRLAAGEITCRQLAQENAFIPYSIDLSRWKVVKDSLEDGGEEILE
ncbi:MAG: hypothetical protein M0Z68_03955 [Gammaproteobacteria bacterium]|nr:hypothetical protein [Gammaproteobacteria bacterium]